LAQQNLLPRASSRAGGASRPARHEPLVPAIADEIYGKALLAMPTDITLAL